MDDEDSLSLFARHGRQRRQHENMKYESVDGVDACELLYSTAAANP